MEKLTHTVPQIRIDEKTRKALDEMALKQRRTLTSLLQLILEDVVILYKKTGVIFTISKKTSEKPNYEDLNTD